MQKALSVKQPVPKLARVRMLFIQPQIFSDAAELPILEFAFVKVAVWLWKLARPVNHICKHFSFVNTQSSVRFGPLELAESMHLCIDEKTDVVSAIWPLEHAIPAHDTVLQVASVNVYFILNF